MKVTLLFHKYSQDCCFLNYRLQETSGVNILTYLEHRTVIVLIEHADDHRGGVKAGGGAGVVVHGHGQQVLRPLLSIQLSLHR